jgi:hypothetical protein
MDSVDRLPALMQRALGALPTPFQQLVFLASLRDSYSGRYLHEGWATVVSADEIHRALRQAHLDCFDEILKLPLTALCGQLQQHFASLGEEERKVAALWLETEPHRDTIPAGASRLEREFFLSQMRAALAVLASALSLEALPERFSWPPQRPVLQPPRRQDT